MVVSGEIDQNNWVIGNEYVNYNRLKHRGLLEEIMHYIREDLMQLEGRKINPILGILI